MTSEKIIGALTELRSIIGRGNKYGEIEKEGIINRERVKSGTVQAKTMMRVDEVEVEAKQIQRNKTEESNGGEWDVEKHRAGGGDLMA